MKRNLAGREMHRSPGSGWDFKLRALELGDAAAPAPSSQGTVMDRDPRKLIRSFSPQNKRGNGSRRAAGQSGGWQRRSYRGKVPAFIP